MRSLIGAHPAMQEIPWEGSAAPTIRPPEVESEEAEETEETPASHEKTRPSTDPAVLWQGTNFEIKYASEGRQIYRAAFRRLTLCA
jgi:hypothetical protein